MTYKVWQFGKDYQPHTYVHLNYIFTAFNNLYGTFDLGEKNIFLDFYTKIAFYHHIQAVVCSMQNFSLHQFTALNETINHSTTVDSLCSLCLLETDLGAINCFSTL